MRDHAELANINGTIEPLATARVPVTDHGFLYGDSVYETLRTYARRPFLVPAHLGRLERSAESIRLRLPWDRAHVTSEIDRTIGASGGEGELVIRLIATRGSGPMGYDLETCVSPSLVILLFRLHPVPAGQREGGVAAVISSVRRNPIESLDPGIKSSNLLNNILAAQDARDAGVHEAILFNTSGHLAEGTMTNVFFVIGGHLMTPSPACGILRGVTRDLLIELARETGIPCEEGRFDRRKLEAAEEIFITSTTREILPVTRLDSRPVGGGVRGPVTGALQRAFGRQVEAFLATTPTGAGGG